jgi:hypothetical protein
MFQHNRQHIATHGMASAATARKLIALSRQPAPFVLRSTIVDETETQEVSARVSFHDETIAGLSMKANSVYYLVASKKFLHRYYVVIKQGERLICSSHESGVATSCLHAVAQYQAEARATIAA